MPTRPELTSEKTIPAATIIEVESAGGPGYQFLCCKKNTIQEQIDYPITINHQRFIVKDVWANSCNVCDDIYFDVEVGDAIMDKIFEIQHPNRIKWDALMNGNP